MANQVTILNKKSRIQSNKNLNIKYMVYIEWEVKYLDIEQYIINMS